MFFRRSSSMRVVSDLVAEGDLVSDSRPSLFLAGYPSGRSGDSVDTLENTEYGSIDDVGFSGNWSDPLRPRPPRNMAYKKFGGDFYTDRFFHVQPGECGSHLAHIDINERAVYDDRMRGSIDYTGFEATFTLHPEAFEIVADVLEISKPREQSYNPSCFLIRIPTAAFSFPAQRGLEPWPEKHARQLCPIKRLKVQDMVVARATRRDAQVSDDASFLERYQILRASKLAVARK